MELLPEGSFTNRSNDKQTLGHGTESFPVVPAEETAAGPRQGHSPNLLLTAGAQATLMQMENTRLPPCTPASFHLRESLEDSVFLHSHQASKAVM